MTNQRIPPRSGEVTAIEFMFGLISEFERAKTTLRKRIELTGQTRLFRELCTKLDHFMHNILMTVPEEKLYTLKANLRAQQMKIIIGDPPPEGRLHPHQIGHAAKPVRIRSQGKLLRVPG